MRWCLQTKPTKNTQLNDIIKNDALAVFVYIRKMHIIKMRFEKSIFFLSSRSEMEASFQARSAFIYYTWSIRFAKLIKLVKYLEWELPLQSNTSAISEQTKISLFIEWMH